jgi:hypothetical protein
MYLYRSILSLNDIRHFGINPTIKPSGLRLKVDNIIPLGMRLLAKTLSPNRADCGILRCLSVKNEMCFYRSMLSYEAPIIKLCGLRPKMENIIVTFLVKNCIIF